MTLNPPEAVEVLREFRRLNQAGKSHEQLVSDLSEALRRHLGKTEYNAFLGFWHLHLQSIPLAIAVEAWGITQTQS